MKNKIINMFLLLTIISNVGCSKQDINTNVVEDNMIDTIIVYSEVETKDKYKFSAYVHEIHDTYIIVNPIKTTTESNVTGLISIDFKHISDDSLPTLGDTYEITYDGLILETYPAQLHEIYEMKRTSVASKIDNSNYIKLVSEDSTHTLYEIDINALNAVIDNYVWKDGTSDCLSDYELVIDNIKYSYHEECGTLNDNSDQKSITFNDKDKEQVNDLLKQFVSIRHWSSGPIQSINN